MHVILDSLIEGARRAEGVAVIVDVYRAMTSAAVILAGGARHLWMVAGIDEALELRAAGTAELCAGEVDGIRPPDFDFGNSPWELSRADLAGRNVVLSTRAGTTGIAAATRARRWFAGALVNVSATAAVLRAAAPDRVTIVAMGWKAGTRTDEDELTAALLRDRLEGRPADAAAVRAAILSSPESQKFGDPARPWFHREDRDMALDIDRHAFAIEVVRRDRLFEAVRVDPGAAR